MFVLLAVFLTSQFDLPNNNILWNPPNSSDVLIEDSLGSFADFAVDYNYSNGNIYAACVVDSGHYFGDTCGLIIFQSTDHGNTWINIFSSAYNGLFYKSRDIDLVVSRHDTLFLSAHAHNVSSGTDIIEYYKVYEGSGQWFIDFMNAIGTSKEFASQRLIRDDFDPFYLYRGYVIKNSSNLDSLYIERSTNKCVTWTDTIYSNIGNNFSDMDITVSDSTLYFTYINYNSSSGYRRIWNRIFRGRGFGYTYSDIISTTYDTTNSNIFSSRIGATTTTPDSGQLAYIFYTRDDASTGGTNLLYKYSTDGGYSWTATPDTMLRDTAVIEPCDLRGYQAGENPYMNITYQAASGWNGRSYWRWSSESNPTGWSSPDTVTPWLFLGVKQELVYSPGSPGSGSGVVYSDISGSLWFDAPWLTSGIDVVKEEDKFSVNKNILHSSENLSFSHPGVEIFDITGRKVRSIKGRTWNLRDNTGRKVDPGIYFIKSKKSRESEKVVILK